MPIKYKVMGAFVFIITLVLLAAMIKKVVALVIIAIIIIAVIAIMTKLKSSGGPKID
jgi:hypothetical protein